MWNHALCESLLSVKFCPLWAFCETLLSLRPCLLWGLAFCETLASVRLCLLWGPSLCETLSWFYDTLPSVRHSLCLMGETLSSVKPCLSVRPCLPWCVRPCRLFDLSKNVLHVYRLYLAPIIDQVYNPKLQLWKNVQGRSCHSAANQKVSKSSSHVGAVEESNSSGACDFTGENTFRCGIHCSPCLLCESLLWVTHLAFSKVLPSAKSGLPWDPGFCESLPSVRPWLLWGLAFCETLPSLRPCLCS